MAHLGSVSKAGYFPLPAALLPAVAAAVVLSWDEPAGSRSYERTRHAIFDPCAGDGEAIFTLAAAWKHNDLEIFASELETIYIGPPA